MTGGAGFIGSHLVDALLAAGAARVVIFDNFLRGTRENIKAAMDDPRTTCFESEADLLDVEATHSACEGMDGVFHLASLCLGHCQDDPRKGYDINVTGTFNILEASGANDVKRVMCASSSSVYGNAVYTPMDEDHPFMNQNFYGATKIAGEAIVNAFHHTHGLDYLNFRFMNVYGPRQDYEGAYVAVIIKAIDRILQGLPPIIYGDGSQVRDWLYVEDHARALYEVITKGQAGETYNIGGNNEKKNIEVVEYICDLLDELAPSKLDGIESYSELITFVEDRPGHDQRYAIDSSKIKKELGWKPTVNFEEGLRETVKWYLDNKEWWERVLSGDYALDRLGLDN